MKEAEHITNLKKRPVELFMMDGATLGCHETTRCFAVTTDDKIESYPMLMLVRAIMFELT